MYKLHFGGMQQPFVILIATNTFVSLEPSDPANTDYQEYLNWLAEGNTPEPADQPE